MWSERRQALLQRIGLALSPRGRRSLSRQRAALWACILLAMQGTPSSGGAQASTSLAELQRGFLHPPDDTRPMMRWWWFGASVVKPELEREILAMKAGGIGGFEIQPVYPLALDDAASGFKNLPYLSDGFLDAVRFANNTARVNGLRVDMTLASGWPYGGPHVPVDQAAGRLRVEACDIAAGATSVPAPSLAHGETLLATFVGEGSPEAYKPEGLRLLTSLTESGRMTLSHNESGGVAVFYISSRTGQQVKRPAVGAEGFVLDHLNRQAVETHLQSVGERLMTAFGPTPPHAVFSDSLEVYGADWTDDLLPEFQRRRGYDLKPLLPLLVSGTSEVAKGIRRDWGLTLTELVEERYLTPINQWATAHGTSFRSQTYGIPAVSLSSNRLVALPEGEGPQWDRFSYTRLATSASHLYDRTVTSAEAWTWLHSPAFRATPLDMKAEADRFFIEGVNQFIGHGWPYTPPDVAEPGWAFYAAAVFSDHNPWYFAMPAVMTYLQRVSFLLRQGRPARDIAVFLPDDDAYSAFAPGRASLSDEMPNFITPALMQAIQAAGHNPDYIDSQAIAQLGIPYPLLILPHVKRISARTLHEIDEYVKRGGRVIAVGSQPTFAAGYLGGLHDISTVTSLVKDMFSETQRTWLVAADEDVQAALGIAVEPEVKLAGNAAEIGFVHRSMTHADVYFLANTSNHTVSTTATFRGARAFASMWDPFTGSASALEAQAVSLTLAPYESRVVLFSDEPVGVLTAAPAGTPKLLDDLSHGWTLRLGNRPSRSADATSSWTADADDRFFSGTAVYSRHIRLSAGQLAGAISLRLDFGEGTPVTVDPKIKSGMRALLESPVHEAAEVSVNGKHVGVVWHPPFVVDVTSALHAGDNTLDIKVGNTAINTLAGRAPTDYRLLNARYGERFSPQDMDNLQPLPSGLLGGVRLLKTK